MRLQQQYQRRYPLSTPVDLGLFSMVELPLLNSPKVPASVMLVWEAMELSSFPEKPSWCRCCPPNPLRRSSRRCSLLGPSPSLAILVVTYPAGRHFHFRRNDLLQTYLIWPSILPAMPLRLP